MKRATRKIEEFLVSQRVEFDPIELADAKEVEKRWLHAFAQNVKKETGSWIFNKFKWHGFRCKYESALEGKNALRRYHEQWPAPYYLFDEGGNWCYQCQSDKYTDFTGLRDDIYVAHHNLKWTMVFTHEQAHDGPYFTMRT